MMVLHRDTKRIEHRVFREIAHILDDSYVLVLNNTRVIPARLKGRKETGAKVELLLVRRVDEDQWECMVRPAKRLKKGAKVLLDSSLTGTIEEELEEGRRIVRFQPPGELDKRLNQIGEVPLPPYIEREATPYDRERYQTVFALKNGSVAAPTAGLHFTEDTLRRLKDRGVEILYVTLHVGPGTFKPVKTEHVEEHRMDAEYYEIPEDVVDRLLSAKAEGKKILACGTTVVRTLESFAQTGKTRGWTDLFIYPGYNFRMVDALLTNFHLPKSTLIMLVCAFAGKDFIMEAYNEAIKRRYRFYSYGDCMLIL